MVLSNTNISNAGTITSSNVYAATAVIGTPSAYGNSFAYFGNNSLASNGGEYALLQANNGTTYLNCKVNETIRFRNGNYDIMVLSASNLSLCNNSICNVGRYLQFASGPYLDANLPGGYTNAFLDIRGTGGDSQLRLINGTAEIALRGNSDLGITPRTGSSIVLNGPTRLGGNLDMNDNPIRLRVDQYHALVFGNSGTYNVGINGPFLVGYRGGALGSSDPVFNDKSFAWSSSNLVAYKPLDMNSNNISNVGAITATGLGVGVAPIATAGSINITNSLYINGVDAIQQVYNMIEANLTLSGGGIVTWSGGIVSWTTRVIAIPIPASFGSDGFFNIEPATFNLNTGFSGFGGWTALYYTPTVGAGYAYVSGSMRSTIYPGGANQMIAQSNSILICVWTADDDSLKWLPGPVHIPNGGYYNSGTGQVSLRVQQF